MDIEKSFGYTASLRPTTVRAIENLEQMYFDIATDLNDLPESREKSLCLTKLQESEFWAVECLAKVLN